MQEKISPAPEFFAPAWLVRHREQPRSAPGCANFRALSRAGKADEMGLRCMTKPR